jgi:hypothetical protein
MWKEREHRDRILKYTTMQKSLRYAGLALLVCIAMDPAWQSAGKVKATGVSKVPVLQTAANAVRQQDSILYHQKMKQLANGDLSGRWPPQNNYPGPKAILPFKRIIAYYGNFYSAGMGILGEFPETNVLEKLSAEVKAWERADQLTPALPAIHYIAVTAQPCRDFKGKCRLRMPASQIDKAVAMAAKLKGIVFLDIQVGQSTLQDEIPLLKKYLQMPQVHLAIDPEFSMKQGQRPGTAIGTFDASDVNYAIDYLDALVKEYDLPPKILVVHRFTGPMLTNYKKINTGKQVQVVINMDGFGYPAKKKNTYYHCIYKEPVQFAGIKIFYKNDQKQTGELMNPADMLKLVPQPIYIQYQ